MFSFAQFGNDLYTGKKSFDFVGRWKFFLGLGAALCIIAILLLATLRLNPGIEFRGGSEFRITGTTVAEAGIGEQVVRDAYPEAEPPRATVIGGTSVRVQTEQLDDQATDALRDQLAEAYGVDRGAVTSSFVGPSWGQDITNKALLGMVIFLVLVTLLITGYFRTLAMAMAAMIALVHDLLITAGIYSLTGFEVTPGTVIGFLTILGYSLYDTVVVFDKIRENTEHVMSSTKMTFAEATNLAVNQTVVRSINTSIVAVLPVGSILFIGALLLGAGTLRDISLSLFVGMIVGAYSSVFIAPAMYVVLRRGDEKVIAQADKVERARAAGTSGVGEPVMVGVVSGAAVANAAGDEVAAERADHAARNPEAPRQVGQRQQPKRGRKR